MNDSVTYQQILRLRILELECEQQSITDIINMIKHEEKYPAPALLTYQLIIVNDKLMLQQQLQKMLFVMPDKDYKRCYL